MMTEAERRRHIQERQKTSLAWRIIHILGSLKLALTLLSTIAIACAIATFTESNFSAQVARDYVYKAPWFLLWLGVLCINLIAATLTRWPWQRKHTGFIVTHAGIITLLFGAVVGMKTGFEANVTLHKGEPPANRLVINETILQVDSPRDGAIYIMPLPVQTRRPTEEHPRLLPIPDSKTRLKVEAYEEGLIERSVLIASEAMEAAPGVVLRFQSGMMKQEVPVQVSLTSETAANHDFFGLASIELMSAVDFDAERPKLAVDETHVVFANQPDTPIVHAFSGKPSGSRVLLSRSANGLAVDFGDGVAHPVDSILNKPQTMDALIFEVSDLWLDFEMREGKPISASAEPNNPAILVRVTGSVPADAADKPKLFLTMDSGALRYKILRHGKPYADGTLKQGDSFPLGWADWQAEVVAAYDQAVERPEVVSVTATDVQFEAAIPGIRVRLVDRDGKESDPVWVRSGRSEAVSLGSEIVRIGFGLRTHRLPFGVELTAFDVPRDEGTQTPANFISSLRFSNFESGAGTDLVSRMNHPASYPGGFWRSITGLTYKFSQASWNPEDLDETTLQVLYDPGWMFKWIGSLMISLGIGFMFYLRPARKLPANV